MVAVCELATNSVRHANGRGVLQIWQEDDALVCEVSDRGQPARPLAAPELPEPHEEGGYGLWIASRLCDRIHVCHTENGSVIRLYMAIHAG